MRPTRLIAAALVTLVACQKPETPEQTDARIAAESDSLRPHLEAVAASFARHLAAGQVDSMALLYAEDASLMPPNMPLVTGRDNVRATFQAMLSGGQFTPTLRVENVTANGPMAVERGRFVLAFTPTPGTPAPAGVDSGNYLIHWHRSGGTWSIVEEMWNSELPPPPPPPPARRGS